MSGQVRVGDCQTRPELGAVRITFCVFTAQCRTGASILLPASVMVERLAVGADYRSQVLVSRILLNSAGANWTAQAQPICLGNVVVCYPDSLVFTHRLFSHIVVRVQSLTRLLNILTLFYHEPEAHLGQGNSYASTLVICRSQQKKPLRWDCGSRTMATCQSWVKKFW